MFELYVGYKEFELRIFDHVVLDMLQCLHEAWTTLGVYLL